MDKVHRFELEQCVQKIEDWAKTPGGQITIEAILSTPALALRIQADPAGTVQLFQSLAGYLKCVNELAGHQLTSSQLEVESAKLVNDSSPEYKDAFKDLIKSGKLKMSAKAMAELDPEFFEEFDFTVPAADEPDPTAAPE